MRNIIIISLLVLVSCGTRNVNKTSEKLDIKTKDTLEVVYNAGKVENTTTNQETTTEENTKWDFSNGSLSPIDPEKPMTHTGPDGKTNTYSNANVNFGNASGTSIKKTNESVETKYETKDTSTVRISKGSVKEIKKELTVKDSESKGVATNIKLWIGSAIGVCIVLWLLWFVIIKKNKINES